MTERTQSPAAQSEAIAIAFLSRAWRGHDNDLDVIDELMTEDYQVHSAMSTVSGRAAFREWLAQFQAVLTDARNEILDVFATESGDRVVARWLCTGVNNGIFGLPPDGRPVAFTGIAIWRVRHGRLAECWIERAGLEAWRALAA